MILLLLSTITISCRQTRDINVFFISDLSQEAMIKEEPFFTAEISNDDTTDTNHYTLIFKIISNDYGKLVEGISSPFTFSVNTIEITSQSIMEENSLIRMQDYKIEEGGDELKRILRTTGVLPGGSYTISLIIKNNAQNTVAEKECSIELKNPGNIESISPGTPYGSPPQVISNTRPVFQWSSDGDLFKIVISKVGRDNISQEEAIEEMPIFTADNVSGYIFQYPDNAPELEDGLYAWQITSTSMSSSGEFKVKSGVYWFQVLTSQSKIIEILKHLLGEDNPYIKEIILKGYIPTGKITINGNYTGTKEFSQIMNGLTQNDIEKIGWR